MNSTVFHVYFVDRLIGLGEGCRVHELNGKEVRNNCNNLILFLILLENILELASSFPDV